MSTEQEPTPETSVDFGHRITWRLERNTLLPTATVEHIGKFVGMACENGNGPWAEYLELEETETCYAAVWINDTGAPYLWMGDYGAYTEKGGIDGPIIVWWDGGDWVWRFTSEQPVDLSDPGETVGA